MVILEAPSVAACCSAWAEVLLSTVTHLEPCKHGVVGSSGLASTYVPTARGATINPQLASQCLKIVYVKS